ncbi:MAG: type II toxin-antitoxin system Phd/YefM family antitoxin [Gemmatimonadetes bacterium]|nr:type II toxin-antitoxin system Phd/YefM family antitoxin [Gemmatimonadota bacterium]
MKVVNVHQAKTELSKLLERAEAGEDVVIARAGTPVARLVPVRAGQRRPGRLKGKVRMSEDFDAPLPGEMRRAFGESDR